ncbi:hypothetical protein SFR_4367 [Streptomyces sp. FR-008]|nr:hypothetical protein SFR_4367 [Streptomyces sp. FR-008]
MLELRHGQSGVRSHDSGVGVTELVRDLLDGCDLVGRRHEPRPPSGVMILD